MCYTIYYVVYLQLTCCLSITGLSSITRGIDQFTIIAAPALTGLLMSYGSMFVSAIFVAGWNICSVFIEYALLLRIYNKVPALAVKGPSQRGKH